MSGAPEPPRTVTLLAVPGIGEVHAGTDLAAVVSDALWLHDGDVVVVTSKVVGKAEGRVRSGARDDWLPVETDRVVARRGPTTIVRTRHGLVLAAAGIDASNVARGTVVLLPEDPDRSARLLRERLLAAYGVNVAVLVSDTSGRAWRTGQTDIAIGAAGLVVLQDHGGRVDGHGNPLQVTAPALADELAGAADLVKGKLAGRPVAVVRGLADLVLAPGEHGSGAVALVRAEEEDLFGYGARDAVVEAVLAVVPGAGPGGATGDRTGRGFGAPAPAEALADVVRALLGDRGTAREHAGELVVTAAGSGSGPGAGIGAADSALVAVLARAHGWEPAPSTEADPGDLVLRRLGSWS